jgi:integrase/recombinase XerD
VQKLKGLYEFMMLLLETGVRANELVGMKTADIIQEEKAMRIET